MYPLFVHFSTKEQGVRIETDVNSMQRGICTGPKIHSRVLVGRYFEMDVRSSPWKKQQSVRKNYDNHFLSVCLSVSLFVWSNLTSSSRCKKSVKGHIREVDRFSKMVWLQENITIPHIIYSRWEYGKKVFERICKDFK